ncbi:MAG: hypothetical protein V3T31_05755, partial [candidate division Zixibacteria bacterium]
MAIAKKTTGSAAPRTSRRKATGGKKTSHGKTKIVKGAVQQAVTPVATEKRHGGQTMVMTNRRQRMVERAKVRAQMPAEIVTEPEVKAVKITDVSGIVYDKADYDAMVEMYDSTIKDIKEGEIVNGRIIGVTLDDVIVDVGFKSEGIIQLGEFEGMASIAVGDEVEVFLEQIEDSNGALLLSKQKADFMRVWEKIRDV